MSFKADEWRCVEEDVQGYIELEVADLLSDALQTHGVTLDRAALVQLSTDLVSRVVARASLDSGQQLARMLPGGGDAYGAACSQAALFLEAFAPQLHRIADEHGWPAELVRKYAARRIRGQYAYAPRPIMAQVDQLIADNPPGGEWEQRIGQVRVRVVMPNSRRLHGSVFMPDTDLRGREAVVFVRTEGETFSIYEASSKITSGQVLNIPTFDQSAYALYRQDVDAWKAAGGAASDLPMPHSPPSDTIAYVRAADGRLVYVGDRDGDLPYVQYLYDAEPTLRDLVGMADAREGNAKGHPLYEHSIEPVL